MKVVTESEIETGDCARDIARSIAAPRLIFLRGDLGAGKSVFARSLVRALCSDENLEVPSPTFTLVQTYEFEGGEIYHYDLYRLEDGDEVYELGWDDALYGGIVLVEWPERLAGLEVSPDIDILIKNIQNKNSTREIIITRYDN